MVGTTYSSPVTKPCVKRLHHLFSISIPYFVHQSCSRGKFFVRKLRSRYDQIDNVRQEGIPVADLTKFSRLLKVHHDGQEALETRPCIFFASHQTMDVPDIVENNHGLRDQDVLFAHQHAVGDFVISQTLAQQHVIDCATTIIVASTRTVLVSIIQGFAPNVLVIGAGAFPVWSH